jgi:hypothetical protein
MKDSESITLTPIGLVKTSTPPELVKKRQHISEIILRTDLTDALNGINEFYTTKNLESTSSRTT